MEKQRNKQPIWKKRNTQKPARKKFEKLARMKCDSCSKKFWPDDMYVKHKPITYMHIPRVRTEGMRASEFKRLYSDKRLRPFHDRKCNVMIVCGPCFTALKKKFEKS
ncbi:MAG: hypothetical protein NT016_03700 [Candidatus Aenigmarchaeota archaeon]|nr:hypothetical protein [Candidatus Aenigmarchaeota archaeon]